METEERRKIVVKITNKINKGKKEVIWINVMKIEGERNEEANEKGKKKEEIDETIKERNKLMKRRIREK
jgi:hypothetical protein